MTPSILIVCEGNICRSPMAQALLAQQLPGLCVRSAGLSAAAGKNADPTAVALMAERGIDIGQHVASAVNLEHVRAAQLIFVMGSDQKRRIEVSYPFVTGKTFTLGQHTSVDIIDPYRMERPVFEAALRQIDAGIAAWLSAIKQLFS